MAPATWVWSSLFGTSPGTSTPTHLHPYTCRPWVQREVLHEEMRPGPPPPRASPHTYLYIHIQREVLHEEVAHEKDERLCEEMRTE